MALFKILKGAGDLPEDKHNGWAYVKKIDDDKAEFYVDYDDTTRLQIGKYENVNSTSAGLFSPEMFEKFTNIAEGATKVSFAQTLTSGVEIGAITINDVTTKLYSSPTFQGASATTDGVAGIVPPPTAGNQKSFLRGDGIWYNFLDLDTDVLDTLSAIKAAWEAGDSGLQAALTSKVTNGNPGATTGQASGPATPVYINASGVATAVSLVTPTVTWTGGAASGPTLKIKDSLGKESSAVAIPSASLSASGVVNTSSQTFKGTKTFSGNIRLGNPNISGTWSSSQYNTSYTSTPYIYIYKQPASETSYTRSSTSIYTGTPGFYLSSRSYTSSTNSAGTAISFTISSSAMYAYKTIYSYSSGTGSLTNSKGYLDLGTSTNHWKDVYADTFIGDLTGTADVALKLTTSDLGSDKKPIYLAKGAATECLTYAGGTAVTLNGSDKSASTASFYAPAEAGTENQYLRSTGAAPAWTDFKTLTLNVKNITGDAVGTKTITYNPLANASLDITATDLFETYTFEKSLTLTPAWIETGIAGSNMVTGSYIIQIKVNDGNDNKANGLSHYHEIYTGTMSWHAEGTNNTDEDEIVLHKAGHASNANNIYLRTKRKSNSGSLVLEMSCNKTCTVPTTYTIVARRLL